MVIRRMCFILRRTLALSACALTLVTVRPAEATTIYFNDFQGAVGSEWSNTRTSTTPVGARRFLGQFIAENNRPRWETVTLTLGGLPTHTNLALSFDLFIIGSWDGNSTTYGPDQVKVSIAGGPTLLDTTFSNRSPHQSFPDPYLVGDYLRYTGSLEHNTLGYSGGDSVYRLSYDFLHSGSSLVVNFSSRVLGSDETFGLDNVSLSNPVPAPEPGTLLLLGSGLAGLGAWRRMRKAI